LFLTFKGVPELASNGLNIIRNNAFQSF